MTRSHIALVLCLFLFSNLLALNLPKHDSLEQVLLLAENPEQKIDLLLNLSDLYIQDHIQKAQKFAQKGHELAHQLDSEKYLIKTNLQLAKVFKNQNKTKKALGYILTSMRLAKDYNLEEEYAQALLLMARIYVELGEYEKTAELLFEALQIFDKCENNQGHIDVLIMIGGSYYVQGQFDDAEKYLQQSIDLSRKYSYTKGLAKGLSNISAVYNMRDETEKAIDYLRICFKMFQEVGDRVSEGISYNNTALYFLKLNQVDSAFKYTKLAMEVNKKVQNQRNLVLNSIVTARVYLHVKDTNRFLNKMDTAYQMANKQGYKNLSLNIVTVLLDYYEEIHDFEMAFHYAQKLMLLKESLDNENSLTRLSQLKMLYEFEKEEQENRIGEQRKEFIIGIIILSLITSLILLILIVFRFRVKARFSSLKQEKLEYDLHLKQQELTANVMALMKKNEMLTEINERLILIRKKVVNEESKKAITKIAFDIEKNTQGKIWEEFEMRFKQVHSDFYEKLMELYPSLTSNEMRLCSFLKLNLNTKEISSITGQSPRSLEVARYRLRKKMNLNSSVNLSTHINKI